MSDRYLITITTDARWTEPDEIFCVAGREGLETACQRAGEHAAENTGDGATIAVWVLTPIEVVATGFEVINMPTDKPVRKRAAKKKPQVKP